MGVLAMQPQRSKKKTEQYIKQTRKPPYNSERQEYNQSSVLSSEISNTEPKGVWDLVE